MRTNQKKLSSKYGIKKFQSLKMLLLSMRSALNYSNFFIMDVQVHKKLGLQNSELIFTICSTTISEISHGHEKS